MLRRTLFLLLLTCALLLVASLARGPGWQWDLSAGRRNTLPPEAQTALAALPGTLAITAYASDLPLLRRRIEILADKLRLHGAQVSLQFVDPAYHPEQVRALGIRHDGELLLEANGRTERLSRYDDPALRSALLRLARQGEEWIVAVGRGNLRDSGPGGLANFARMLEDAGFRVVEFAPEQLAGIPTNTALLLLADPADAPAGGLDRTLRSYLAQGGRLLWLDEAGASARLADLLGIAPLPGTVVDAAAAAAGLDSPANAILSHYPAELIARPPAQFSVLPGARALADAGSPGAWRQVGRLNTGARSWNETGALRGAIDRDADAGERRGPLAVVRALQQPDGAGRAVVVGDTDFVANQWLGRAGNSALALGLVHWLTGNQALPTVHTQDDVRLHWSETRAALVAGFFLFVLPLAYLVAGFLVRARRRRGRA